MRAKCSRAHYVGLESYIYANGWECELACSVTLRVCPCCHVLCCSGMHTGMTDDELLLEYRVALLDAVAEVFQLKLVPDKHYTSHFLATGS